MRQTTTQPPASCNQWTRRAAVFCPCRESRKQRLLLSASGTVVQSKGNRETVHPAAISMWLSLQTQPFKMKLDGFLDVALNLVFRLSGRDAPRHHPANKPNNRFLFSQRQSDISFQFLFVSWQPERVPQLLGRTPTSQLRCIQKALNHKPLSLSSALYIQKF